MPSAETYYNISFVFGAFTGLCAVACVISTIVAVASAATGTDHQVSINSGIAAGSLLGGFLIFGGIFWLSSVQYNRLKKGDEGLLQVSKDWLKRKTGMNAAFEEAGESLLLQQRYV